MKLVIRTLFNKIFACPKELLAINRGINKLNKHLDAGVTR